MTNEQKSDTVLMVVEDLIVEPSLWLCSTLASAEASAILFCVMQFSCVNIFAELLDKQEKIGHTDLGVCDRY